MGQEPLPLIRPMLAVNSLPFDSDLHLFEVKWDGYRGLLYLDGNTSLRSRNLLDLTGKFPELGHLHQRVARKPAILDGEVVVFEKGKPSFTRLQARGRLNNVQGIKRVSIESPAVYIAFDVLYAGGKSVMERPSGNVRPSWQKWLSPGLKLLCPIISCTRAAAFSMPACPWGWKELSQKSSTAFTCRDAAPLTGKNSGTPWKLTWSSAVTRPAPPGESLAPLF